MSICKLCGLDKKLIKAHIIPKQLDRPIKDARYDEMDKMSENNPIIVNIKSPDRTKRSNGGIYDLSILCQHCDAEIIGKWDEYGQKFLLKNNNFQEYFDCGRKIYKIETFDYEKLKLFFMSILWRSAITSNDFFSAVNIGSWEDILRKMLLAKDAGDKNDFSVILFKYEGKLSEIMIEPTKQRLPVSDGVNCYKFRLPNYGFFIKVDKRNFPSRISPIVLTPNQTLSILTMDYINSSECKHLRSTLNKVL